MPIESLPNNLADWTVLDSEADILSMRKDHFWEAKTSSTDPNNAILFRCGAGYIERSIDGGAIWSDVTPAGPLTGPSGAVAVSNVEFVQIDSNTAIGSLFVVAGRYEDAGTWTSWTLVTYDDGANWFESNLGDAGLLSTGSLGSVQQPIVISSPDSLRIDISPQFNNAIAMLSPTRIVASWFYDANGGTHNPTSYIGVRAGTIDPDNKTITWGDIKIVHDTGDTITRMNVEFFIGSDHETALIGYITFFDSSGSPSGLPTNLKSVHVADDNSISLSNLQTIAKDSSYFNYWGGLTVAAKASARRVVLFYGDLVGGNFRLYLRYVTVNSPVGSFTMETERLYAAHSSGTHLTRFQIISLRDNLFVCLFLRGTSGTVYRHFAAYRLGDVFTFGAYITPSFGYANNQIEKINRSRYVCSSLVPLTSNVDLNPAVLTNLYISPTITFDTVQQYNAGFTVSRITPQATSIGNNEQMVLFGSSPLDARYVVPVTWSGATATFGTHSQIFTDAGYGRQWYFVGGNLLLHGGKESYTFDLHLWDYTGGGTGDFKILDVQFSKVFGAYIWITTWGETEELYLLLHDVATLSELARIQLGDATEVQLDTDLYLCHPIADSSSEAGVFIFGRMDEPQGLAVPEHIIYSGDYGDTWQSVENSWDVSYCSSLIVFAGGGIYAIKDNGSSSELYVGSVTGGLELKITLPFSSGVAPRCLYVDSRDGTVLVCSESAGSVMVAVSLHPYGTWFDITGNHGVAAGISGLAIL